MDPVKDSARQIAAAVNAGAAGAGEIAETLIAHAAAGRRPPGRLPAR